MILYLDTFLSDEPLHKDSSHFDNIIFILNQLRSNSKVYSKESKDEIFKYSILSYCSYDWLR
jgi:hypothetical protein